MSPFACAAYLSAAAAPADQPAVLPHKGSAATKNRLAPPLEATGGYSVGTHGPRQVATHHSASVSYCRSRPSCDAQSK